MKPVTSTLPLNQQNFILTTLRDLAIVCAVVAVVAIVFVVIGATNFFGDVGSAGFVASIVCGGVVTLISVGALRFIVRVYLHVRSLPTQDQIDKLGKEALEFARQKLNEEGNNIVPYTWPIERSSKRLAPPQNPEISLLVVLCANYEEKWKQTLRKGPNPCGQQEAIETTETVMKLKYAIGCMMLEDLPAFLKMNSSWAHDAATAIASRQIGYMYEAFYECPRFYSWVRTGFIWAANENFQKEEGPRRAFIDNFYVAGTPQYNWRMLFNDYCDRVTKVVLLEDLRKGDARAAEWMLQDTSKDFRLTFPGIPT